MQTADPALSPPRPRPSDAPDPVSRRWHRPLVVTAVGMFALVLVSAFGLLFDDRTILGESVWLKTLKFGFSFGAYLLTLAWLIAHLTRARRFGWLTGTLFAAISAVEVGVIALAAALGTFSHFNTSTDPVNEVVQAVFKYGIPVMFVVNVAMAVMVLFQRIGDRSVTTTVRWGLLMSTLGMVAAVFIVSVGGQGDRTLVDANGRSVELNAGHGVGDLDGHGMFLTNWSLTGGDMRVSHFVGLHGIQVFIAAAIVLVALAGRYAWLRDERVRAGLIRWFAIGYLGVFLTVAWQAVRGQSVAAPDGVTLAALAASFAIAFVGIAVTTRRAWTTPDGRRSASV
ncbi:hypothetical protein EXU48_09640 [Occultella glacieicola]|uniref:Uncharacterized protein n=1 Tax=Occultella glacieicola TaxID=2518684 RepID=A0ABY2E4S9_9MICO|nr:hypothetical protein [Occultella glacieicola]TDE95021.1 hypothetical protein EXU48_09640 [Occultella glacieicola]